MAQFFFEVDRKNKRIIITSDEPGQAKIFYDVFKFYAEKNGFDKSMEYNNSTGEIYFNAGKSEASVIKGQKGSLTVRINPPGTYIEEGKVSIWFGDVQLKNVFLLHFNGLKQAVAPLENAGETAMFTLPEVSHLQKYELTPYSQADLLRVNAQKEDWIVAVKDFFVKIYNHIIHGFAFMKDWFKQQLTNIGFFSSSSKDTASYSSFNRLDSFSIK